MPFTGLEQVIDKGAIGDGVTDDTAAIAALLASGRILHFPIGYTFLVIPVEG
ncbi:MAG: hypothetical protein M3Y09_18630 [Actinomycetota bacterium]|nr:hypothetical protein [Actinomycetota bacterium]